MSEPPPPSPHDPDDLKTVARVLKEDLALSEPPVQVTYLEGPPKGPSRLDPPLPSVCSYFVAGRGDALAADLTDHEPCEIGAYVLGLPPTGTLGSRIASTVQFMERVGYLAAGEAARIPRNARAPPWVVYAPLGEVAEPPTFVLFTVGPRGLMLVVEATSSGDPRLPPAPLLSRPMCALVPVLHSGQPVAISVGCAGSRVHTGMSDGEMMVGVRGDALMTLADRVHQLGRANRLVWKEDALRRADLLQKRGGTSSLLQGPTGAS